MNYISSIISSEVMENLLEAKRESSRAGDYLQTLVLKRGVVDKTQRLILTKDEA